MAPDFRLLALNPGSTTSKIAVFAGDKLLLEEKIEHKAEDLRVFEKATDQYEYRLKMIRDALAAAKIDLNTLDAVVGRGGLLKPLPGGTFRVNKQMVDDLLYRPAVDHASNLGAVIAYHLSQKLGIPAFIVDPVVVDEYDEVARISGYPGIQRQSRSHALNMKAVAHKVARDRGRAYRDLRLVVAHLGSGFSISVHVGGRMIDTTNPNDEGPFSIERGGDLPVTLLLPLIYEKFRAGWSLERLQALFIRESGLYAYMGTKDLREVEARAREGDQEAALILEAMSYQVAKAIGAMATVAAGRLDGIILTGGVAHSRRITDDITRRVNFIAPVLVIPGEEELSALAQGALRVLRGEEEAREY
ncbi:MAG: butyrate kinase [Firmicutes bacterium]|nr:butyrate kinase [Bacillota bacterium]